jgi:phosphoadenosine phosphosulfate reductase
METATYGKAGVDATSSVLALTQLGDAGDHPEEILWWAMGRSKRLVQASTFNLEDQVITHILYEVLGERVPVVFVDTLHHFPQTLDVVLETRDRYDLDLVVLEPAGADTRQGFEEVYGQRLWKRDLEAFHRVTKIEPFGRGMMELGADAWITGRRRDQSAARADMTIFELDPEGRLKVNPLAYWTRRMAWAYVMARAIPYNELYERGYASIGDEPLTGRTENGEPERAGRWRGTPKSESGLHY